MQLTAAACVTPLQLLLGSPPAACHIPLSPSPIQGTTADAYSPPQRGCRCPRALAKALPPRSTAQPGMPPLPLRMVLQAPQSHINVLLQKIRVNHGLYRTSPVLGKSTLRVYSISAIAAGLSIWAWMSGPAGSSRGGLRMEKATYF